MSMFTITGEVMNTFFQAGRIDPETGKQEEGKNKVQIMGDIPVADGGSKLDLITLTVPEGISFEPHMRRNVVVPLGFFSPSKGQIIYFIPKGSKVEPKAISEAKTSKGLFNNS